MFIPLMKNRRERCDGNKYADPLMLICSGTRINSFPAPSIVGVNRAVDEESIHGEARGSIEGVPRGVPREQRRRDATGG